MSAEPLRLLVADRGSAQIRVASAHGQAGATTTLDTYSHSWPTADGRTRNAAENLMAETLALTSAD